MARQLERFPNLVTMFFTRAAERGDAPFLWTKQSGSWVATSWADAARQVASLAAGLQAKHAFTADVAEPGNGNAIPDFG